MSALGSLVVKLALEYAEYTKGLDKSDQAALKFAQNAQKHFDEASARAQSFLSDTAKKAGAFVASFVAVTTVIDGLKKSIDTLGNLDDMAQKTGAAVETLSRLQKVASAFDHDFGGVDSAITKLAKGMATVDDESNKTNKALTALGVSSKDAAGRLRDPAQVMIDVAARLQNYKDGAAKAALANDLFGKSGADLLPYLNDVAENVDKFSGVSAEAAKRAADLQDKLGLMKVKTEELYTRVANAAVPAMLDFLDAFNDVHSAADGLSDADMTSWADDLAVGAARVVDVLKLIPKILEAVGGSFQVVGADIQVLAKAGDLLTPVGWAKAVASGQNPIEELKKQVAERNKILEEANARYDHLWNDPANQMEQAMLKRIAERNKAAASGTSGGSPQVELEYTTGNAKPGDFAALNKALQERIALTEKEIELGRPLSEAEKEIAKLERGRAEGTTKLTDAELDLLKAGYDRLGLGDKVLKQREDDVKAAKEQFEATHKLITAAYDNLQTQEDELANYGKLPAEIRRSVIAKLELRKAALETNEGTEEEIRVTEALIEVNRRLASVETTRAYYDSQVSMWKSIDETAHDTFVSIFDSGKNAFDRLRDTLKNGLYDLLYQMTVKQWIINVAANTSGSPVGAALQAANGMSGGNSFLSALGNGSSIYSAFQSSTLGQFFSGYSGSAAAASEALGAPMTTAASMGNMAAQATPYAASLAALYASYNVAQNHGALGGLAAGAGTVAAGGALTGLATGAGALSGATAALAAIPGWGWALGAGLAVLGAMQDGPEQNTRLTFGSNNAPGQISINERGNEGRANQNYIDNYGTGAFGTFGVVSSFWMNAGQPAVQSFIKTVTATDDALAQFMSATEKASVTASLTGHTAVSRSGAEGSDPNGQGGLDAVFKDRIETIFRSLGPGLEQLVTGFKGTAQELGVEAAALLQYRAALVDSGEAVFGAKVTLQQLAALKDPTEATSTALTRITGVFNATNLVASSLGKTTEEAFGAVGLASLKARQQLVDVAGGVDALTAKVGSFAQNFLTEAERNAPVLKAVHDQLAALGYQGIDTREEFKQIVLGLDLTTASGASTYSKLMDLAGAFAQVYPAIEQTTAAVEDQAAVLRERQALQDQLDQLTLSQADLLAKQRSALDESNRSLFDQVQAEKQRQAAISAAADSIEKAQQAATAALQAQRAAVQSFGDALGDIMKDALKAADAVRSFNDSLKLGQLSTLSKQSQYSVAKQAYLSADDSNRQAAATAFLQASQALNGSRIEYARDFALVTSDLDRRASQLDAYAAAIPDFFRAVQQMWGVNGSHASGLDFVPFDGYRAELHKGEMVLPARAAQAVRGGMSAEDSGRLARAIEMLGSRMANVEKYTKTTADRLTFATPSGSAIQVKVTP